MVVDLWNAGDSIPISMDHPSIGTSCGWISGNREGVTNWSEESTAGMPWGYLYMEVEPMTRMARVVVPNVQVPYLPDTRGLG